MVEVVEDLRERKRQELRDMSRGWSGSTVGLLYRWLEGSRGSGEAVVVLGVGEVGEEVTRDRLLELADGARATVGPRRRELAAAELTLLLFVVDCPAGFESWCEHGFDPSLQVEHCESE